MAVIDMKNCKFYFEDGGSNRLELKTGDGTVSYSEKKNREYLMEKGAIDSVRNGDQVPMDVSFQLRWTFLKSNTTGVPSPEDVLKQRGEAAAWETSSADDCEPYCVDLVAVHRPVCTSEVIERVELLYFRYETLDHDFKAGNISCSGKCNAQEATISRGNAYS